MSGKAHRVASRQAELSRKKRRARGRPQVAESTQAPPETTAQATTTVAEPEARPPEPQPQPQPIQAQRAPEAPQPVRRARRRVTAEQASSVNFVGAELRYIGVIAALMVVILVALSFVLR